MCVLSRKTGLTALSGKPGHPDHQGIQITWKHGINFEAMDNVNKFYHEVM
jgi:hypothetical protein